MPKLKNMKKDNLSSVLIKFLKFLKVPIRCQAIINERQTHPHSPSLATINNVLNIWRIPNTSYNISFEPIAEVPLPSLTYISVAV
jgi:hypothetical protein